MISVRLSDEALQCLDDLVSANSAQSRSDAASRLIMNGNKNNAVLFEQIRNHTEESKTFVNGYNNLFKTADWVNLVQLKMNKPSLILNQNSIPISRFGT